MMLSRTRPHHCLEGSIHLLMDEGLVLVQVLDVNFNGSLFD